MSRDYDFFVYMVSNHSGTVLYTGVTNDLQRRLWEHQSGEGGSKFTKHYHVDRLVFYEHYDEVTQAIAREKQLKGWTRAKKEVLIQTINPAREDISQRLDLVWQEPVENSQEFYDALTRNRAVQQKSNVSASVEGPSTRPRLAQDDRVE